jgi:hypothetical protein
MVLVKLRGLLGLACGLMGKGLVNGGVRLAALLTFSYMAVWGEEYRCVDMTSRRCGFGEERNCVCDGHICQCRRCNSSRHALVYGAPDANQLQIAVIKISQRGDSDSFVVYFCNADNNRIAFLLLRILIGRVFGKSKIDNNKQTLFYADKIQSVLINMSANKHSSIPSTILYLIQIYRKL